MATKDRFYEGFDAGIKSGRGRLCTGDGGRPFWQESTCPAWCSTHHTDGDAYDDRCHFSDEAVICLSCEEITAGGSVELRVGLWQHYRELSPRISLHKDDASGVELTTDEAGALIGAVNHLLSQSLLAKVDTESEGTAPSLRSVA